MALTITDLEGIGADPTGDTAPPASVPPEGMPSLIELEAIGAEQTPQPAPAVTSENPIDVIINQEFESDRNDITGFWPSLKSGFGSLYTSAVRVPAAILAEGVTSLVEEVNPELGAMMRADTEGFFRGPEGEKKSLQMALERQAARPVSETMKRLGKADDWDTFTSTFMDSEEKWTVVKELLGLSLPTTLGIAAATVYGGLPATYAASYTADWGNGYLESRAQGKDHDTALVDATIKAMVQAGFDTIAMGIAGKVLHGSKMINMLGQATVQALAGGGAEWAKHEAVGEKTTVGQIGIEAAAEFALGPLEVFSRNQGLEKQRAAEEILKMYEEKIRLDPKEATVLQAQDELRKLDEELAQVVPEEVATPIMDNPRWNETFLEDLESTFDEYADGLSYNARQMENKEPGTLTIDDNGEAIGLTAKETLVPGEVYRSTDILRIQNQKADLQKELQETNDQLALADTNEIQLTPSTRSTLDKHVLDLETKIKHLQNQETLYEEIFQRTEGFIKNLNDKLGLETNFLITVGQASRESSEWKKPMPLLEAGSSVAGFVDFMPHTGTWVMGLNPNMATNSDGVLDPNFVETVAHEYGHALMINKFAQLDPKQQIAIRAAYRKWLNKISIDGLNYGDYLEASRGVGIATTRQKIDENDVKLAARDVLWRGGDWYYELGMNEFLAHQFEKMASNPSEVSKAVRDNFADTFKLLKQAHSEVKAEYAQVEPDFNLFMKHLVAKNAYERLKSNLSQIEIQRVEQVAAETATGDIRNIVKKALGKDYPDNLNNDLDTYNVFYKYGAGLTHLAKDNPHIHGLQQYLHWTKRWWNEKMKWISSADEVLKAWSKYVGLFNKDKKGNRFAKFMLDLTVKSFDGERRLQPTDKEFIDLANKYEIDEEGMALYDMVDREFRQALDALHDGIETHIRRTWAEDPVEQNAQLAKLEEEMAILRDRNFFPLSRFGKHYVHIKVNAKTEVDGVTYEPGDTLSFTTFEKEKQALKFFRSEKAKKNFTVQKGVLSNFQQTFAGIPPDLINMLKDRLELTEEQKQELNLFLHERAPGQSFKKHLLNRKQTAGFSLDAMRGFANYFMHFSNHIAKVKYTHPMDTAIKEVEKTVITLPGDASKRQQIADHLKQHKDYIMNPGNELANLRSLGFLWYLGFVPKSAVVNLTQIPMVTYPYLAARYGDAEAVNSIAAATKTFGNLWRNPNKVSEDVVSMLEQLKQTGIIDESMATEMAAVAEGSIVQKFAPGWAQNPRAHRFIRTAAGWGAYMFQQAERSNRRITAIAAFELAKKRGFGFEGAVKEAEKAVESTQYEYARWDRPFFAQKKRSIFFLFWMYRTNTMHFVLKDPGNTRYLAMLFLMAGLSGLPFAEDIMDLYDWMARKINKELGEGTTPVDIRLELQETVKAMDMNPDLIMHGASRYMFGLPALADMMGIPLANSDISGSLSMGRMIPGVGGVLGRESDFETTVTRGAEEVGGAVLAVPFNLAKAISDDNPNTLKRFERAMPSFARNMSKAYRFWSDEADVTNTGAELVEFDLQDWKHRAEIVQQALGFAPTRSQVEKEKYWVTKELVDYYTIRRTMLMADFDYARRTEDQEGEEYIREKIKEFNSTVPIRGFRISGNDLLQSVRRRTRARRRIEKGRFTPDKARALQRRVDQAYPTSEEKSSSSEDPHVILEEVLRK